MKMFSSAALIDVMQVSLINMSLRNAGFCFLEISDHTIKNNYITYKQEIASVLTQKLIKGSMNKTRTSLTNVTHVYTRMYQQIAFACCKYNADAKEKQFYCIIMGFLYACCSMI